MAITQYTGSIAAPIALNASPICSLSGGGGVSGAVDSVVGKIRFSTNAYANTYSVTVKLFYEGGTVSATRDVKMNSSNYTDAVFSFNFSGVSVAAANAITQIQVSCGSNADKIFLKGGQAVDVSFTIITSAGAPSSAVLSASVAETNPSLSWSGAAGGTANAITGYEIQYAESIDGATWGAWTAEKIVSTSATSGSTTVTVPGTRGRYRKFRIRTRGAAGANYYSGWKDAGQVRRNSAPTAPASVTAGPTPYEAGGIAVSWSGAADADGNIVSHEVQRAASADGSTWGSWANISTGAPGSSLTDNPSVARGQYVKYRARAKDAFGVTGNYTESAAVRRNQVPEAPTINFPTAGKTTSNSRPWFLVTLGTEPDGQVMTLAADGYTPSSTGPYASGRKLALRRTNATGAGSVSLTVTPTDSQGAAGTAAARETTYSPAAWADTLTAGRTKIKAAHMAEIRTAVDQARAYYGLSAYLWAEQIVAGRTSMAGWAGHVLEIRAAIQEVVTLVNGWDAPMIILPVWLSVTAGQPRADVMAQLRTVAAMI